MIKKPTSVIIYIQSIELLQCEVGGSNTSFGSLLEIIVSSSPLAVKLIYERGEELYAGLPFVATYDKQ